MGSLLFCLCFAYLAATVWETLLHWKVLHANRATRLRWRQKGGIFGKLRRGWFSHNVIHHRQTYQSYFTQFKTPQAKKFLDSKLKGSLGESIRRNQYGLTVSTFWEISCFTLPPIFAVLLLYPFFHIKYIMIGFVISTLPMWLSKYVHPLLHIHPEILQKKPFQKWLNKTAYFCYIRHCHFLHHKYGLCNFNLLPGGDYLLRVYKQPDISSGLKNFQN